MIIVITRFQSHHIQGWQQLFRILQKASQETTICPPSISYPHQIQTQLHSQRTKTHRGQMLLKYIYKTTPIHIR